MLITKVLMDLTVTTEVTMIMVIMMMMISTTVPMMTTTPTMTITKAVRKVIRHCAVAVITSRGIPWKLLRVMRKNRKWKNRK